VNFFSDATRVAHKRIERLGLMVNISWFDGQNSCYNILIYQMLRMLLLCRVTHCLFNSETRACFSYKISTRINARPTTARVNTQIHPSRRRPRTTCPSWLSHTSQLCDTNKTPTLSVFTEHASAVLPGSRRCLTRSYQTTKAENQLIADEHL